MSKVQMKILGISAGNIASSYTLLLEEVDGDRKLPIVIGVLEAQAIAIELEKIESMRPMTHDLFKHFAKAFNIYLTEVYIYKLHEGVFYSNLIASDGKIIKEIDSRTSDAIALAIRFNCPIYAEKQVLDDAGISIKSFNIRETDVSDEESDQDVENIKEEGFDESIKDILNLEDDLSNTSISKLKKFLKDAIAEEDYIKAAKIRDTIKKIESKNLSNES